MKNFAIYTAIVGDYDNIRQPNVVDERFDYYLFSNEIHEETIGIWQVRPIPYYNEIQTKIARWVKTHPEELLPDYGFSLWMDANISINTDYIYQRYIELIDSGEAIASIIHPERDCAYDEGAICMAWGLEKESVGIKWLRRLYKKHFPKNNGLWETGVLFRNHFKTEQFDRLWWNCIDKYSRRDQMSFSYVLWKTGIQCVPFLPQTENVRNSTHVSFFPVHKNTTKKGIPFNKKNHPFLFYYIGLFPDFTFYNELYCKVYTKPCPVLLSRLYAFFYRTQAHLRTIKNTIRGCSPK